MKHDFLDLSGFQAAEHPEKSQTKQTLITEDLVSGFYMNLKCFGIITGEVTAADTVVLFFH